MKKLDGDSWGKTSLPEEVKRLFRYRDVLRERDKQHGTNSLKQYDEYNSQLVPAVVKNNSGWLDTLRGTLNQSTV